MATIQKRLEVKAPPNPPVLRELPPRNTPKKFWAVSLFPHDRQSLTQSQLCCDSAAHDMRAVLAESLLPLADQNLQLNTKNARPCNYTHELTI